MSEMEDTDLENSCSNDLVLLDRVFLRLGNADTDEQLANCLNRFLPPVILKLSSPHEQVRTKVMELLVHVNKRVKCRGEVQLPVETLLKNYKDPKANSFITNFSIIYITMGYPRLPKDQQLALAPSLIESIENKPQGHQDGILMLVMPLLGEIKDDALQLKDKPQLSALIVKFATDILLLPYRALPSNTEDGEEFQVPPGMSMKTYKRIVDKNVMNANQLEEIKLSIVNFISKDIFNPSEVLLPLIIAAADSRFSIANHANSPLIHVANSVDWSSRTVVFPLYFLYLGTPANVKIPAEDRKVAACTRLRLRLIQYLNKATGAGILFPQCIQVVFFSLFDANSNTRLRNLALTFLLNILQNGDVTKIKKVASIFLQGLLKVIRSEENAHHAKAYVCLGRLAVKCPECINNQFALLEELVKKVPEAPPDMKTSLRDAILEMAVAYKIAPQGKEEERSDAMDTSEPVPEAGTSKDSSMDIDGAGETKKSKPNNPLDEPQALALFALLEHYMYSEDNMIRYIAMRYAATVFPTDYIPSRYLLLLASGDGQDDISNEAKKCLYGTFRPNEIDDVVNNVSQKETNVVNLDEETSSGKNKRGEVETLKVPNFKDVVNYIWEQMQKRKTGSNTKHRFVVNNHVLQFHPITFQEILRYLRMCLNHGSGLKDCSDHPNATSPLLSQFIHNHLLDTDLLERYLTMITTILNASPELMPLTSFLDIVGCVPDKMSLKYLNMLPFFKNLFINSTKEDIRNTSSLIYAIIMVSTSEKSAIDKEIEEFVSQSLSNKNLESQCGYASAFSHMCERCIAMAKKGKFGGKGFAPANWSPYKAGAEALANFLSNPQSMLVSTACTNIALLGRSSGLPFPYSTQEEETKSNSDNPFGIGVAIPEVTVTNGPVTKFAVVDRLFKIVHNAKLSSKIKEKALFTLGILCCGERFPFARQIIGGFLLMAKDSKEFEIHLQIGESLVMCIEGVNSNENRDLWTQPALQGKEKLRNTEALTENNKLLEWLLSELFKLGKVPHPHSRQATSIWLLALLKNCSEREPIQQKLQALQDIFMDFLSENSEIVQDVASKGLSLVYQSSDEGRQKQLVAQIIDQLTSGKRAVTQVTEDTKIFEEGQLGKAPTGGNLSTYKELCSLASDLNQPDLLYKFMHLAHHNSVWNSKKGAAFGFHSIALQAGAQLSEHLPKIVPRLYRYRFDPTPRIQNSMSSIWHTLVPETQKTVHKYHKEILEDLVTNLTSNQWRVRMSCCNALADLLRGAKSLHDSLEQLPTLWAQLFRVMDDVHEGTRQAATTTAAILSKLCIRASDANQDKDGKKIVSAILPVLLDTGITNLVKEVRSVSLVTVSKLVSAAGATLAPFLPRLVPALVTAAGELEAAKLSHLSTMLGSDAGTRDVLDDMRATAAKHHYTTDTVVKCMPFIDIKATTEMLPTMLELMKSPQLGTKVACCHFFVLVTHHLRQELEPLAGKIMANLLNGALDRNAAVRKNFAEALGQVSAYAKGSSVEKLMKKLVSLYESKDDEITRSAIGLILKAVANAKLEMIKDNEKIIAPMVFLAMHASKDEESSTVEMYEEIWIDISPGREIGIREHLIPICRYLEESLNSRSWTKKIQGALGVRKVCAELSAGPGAEREQLVRALLAAVHGKTFDGKHHLLHALADLCTVKEGEAQVSAPLGEQVVAALVAECRKPEPAHRRHALGALGQALAALHCDAFHHVYDILKGILLKDESTIDKDSDEEDTEGARQRRLQVIALKEAAYELLGNAWPRDADTQEKYEEIFFKHCSTSYPACARSTQLCVLTALARVVGAAAVLRPGAGEPMDVDGGGGVGGGEGDERVAALVGHVALVIDYTLKNINQVRHRRDALNLMDILVKKLKEINNSKDLNKLHGIFQTYVTDLAKDSSHEIRAKVDSIKVQFK